MYFLGNLLIGAAQVLSTVCGLWSVVIVVNAILSWVRPDPGHPLVLLLARLAEPACRPFRRWLPAWQLGVDLSPLFALLALQFINLGLLPSLLRLGRDLAG